jgi:hypothetical protein
MIARIPRALAIAAIATAIACALLLLRFPWIVGPPSWRWPYEANSIWPRAISFLIPFALLMLVARVWLREQRAEDLGAGPRREWRFLAIVVLIAIALEITFLALSPMGPLTLPLIHVVPWVTGYFWAARSVTSLSELLARYPQVVLEQHGNLPGHVVTHPPGLLSINYLLLSFFRGSEPASEAALGVGAVLGITRNAINGATPAELATLITMGLLVVVASCAAVVPAYWLARRIGGVTAARSAALLLALIPSRLLFAGEFDAAFPLLILTALFLVGEGRGRLSLVTAGLLCGLLCLLTFVASFFLLLVAIVDVLLLSRLTLRRVATRFLLLGAGFAAPLALFQIATGCSIPSVFLAAFKIQKEVLIPEQERTWLTWVFWNLADFFLFIGPAIAVLFTREVASVIRTVCSHGASLPVPRSVRPEESDVTPPVAPGATADPRGALTMHARFSIAVVAFLVLLDLSGLIPAETSRVWLFLVAPVVIAAVRGGIPAGGAGMLAILALQCAFALIAKSALLMIDVKLPG